jgi:hypothetical protein
MHVHVSAEQIERFLDVLAPTQRVAGLGATERQSVVHRVGAVFCDAQRTEVREHEVHLSRSFGAGCVLENDTHAVEHQLGPCEVDLLGWRDQVRGRARDALAETTVDMAVRSHRQQRAELVEGPARHRWSGNQVLGNCLSHEPLGRKDPHVTPVDIGLVDHAENAAVVIDMAVRVQHCGDATLTERGVGKVETRFRRERSGQRIDHDPAVVTLDERDVRDVIATRLPDPVGHLEQTVYRIVATVPPQARVHRIGRLLSLAKKVVVLDVPGEPERALDLARLVLCNQASGRPLPVVVQLQRSAMRGIDGDGVICSRLRRARIGFSHGASMS